MNEPESCDPDGLSERAGESADDRQRRRATVEQVAKWALLAPLMTVLFDPKRSSAGADSAAF